MEVSKEINSLSAETLAIQTILAHVLHRLTEIDPKIAGAIKTGFEGAANEAENIAIRLGKTASPDHLVKAIHVIEELRTAALGTPDKLKRGV